MYGMMDTITSNPAHDDTPRVASCENKQLYICRRVWSTVHSRVLSKGVYDEEDRDTDNYDVIMASPSV